MLPGAGSLSPLPRWSRVGLFAVAILSLSVLAVARVIEPDPRGWGTHQQLGLHPCTVRQLSGLRCPACGMTTAWSHFVRGQWWEAWRCNAGGTLLAAVCATAVPWTLGVSLRGEWLGFRPTQRRFRMVCLAIIVVTLGDWLLRSGSQLVELAR